jgi:hypothetical protein
VIGWYVHHHGRGHLHRASTIAARLRTPVVGLSSLPAPDGWPGEWVRLPSDADGPPPVDPTARGTLHWAPVGHPGLRARMGLVAEVMTRPDLRLVVVDVSVEIALLARLSGLPVVVMAQPGERTDRPHRTAYDLAERLLTPWPPLGPAVPDRAVHLGAVSRFDDRVPPEPPGARRVLVLWGAGGVDATPADLNAAACATPELTWEVVGPRPPDVAGPVNLHWHGWREDVWDVLCDADVVVTHAGQNAIAEVAAARRAAVVVPQDRPHGEQHATGEALARAGIGVVVSRWPAPGRWPSVLDEAVTRGGHGWKQWSWGDGATRAAAVLDGLAAG